MKRTPTLLNGNKYKNAPVQVKASFWFLICTVLQRSVSIITTPIFTRLLTKGEYGQYGVFLSWMGILTCFVTMYIFSGIYPQAIVKFQTEKNQYSSAFQGLTCVLVLTGAIIYSSLMNFWNGVFSLNTTQMLAMFVIIWANAIFGFWSAEQRNDYKYRALVIVTLVESVLQPILCVVLILHCPNKVNGLVWGIAIATLMCYAPLLIQHMIKGKVFFSKKMWGYALRLAIPLIPHYISSILLTNSDRIMIRWIVGEDAAGIYTLAYTISICGVLINQAVLQTMQPWIFQRIKGKDFSSINSMAYPALIGIAAVNLLIIVFTPEIVSLFAPASYYEAKWVMPPITMSVYYMFMYNLFASFELYYEKTAYVSMATGVGAILNILLNLVFINLFGYFAAGYTTLICYIVFAVMHYHFMRKACKSAGYNERVYDIKKLIIISAIFMSVGFALMATYRVNIVRYAVIAIMLVLAVIFRSRIKGALMRAYCSLSNHSAPQKDVV